MAQGLDFIFEGYGVSDPSFTFDLTLTTSGTVDPLHPGGVTALSVSGTVNGQQVTGLSNYAGADNEIYWSYPDGRAGLAGPPLGVDQSGLSVSAGGVNYNFSEPGFAQPGSTAGLSLINSSGINSPQQVTAQLVALLCFASETLIRTDRGDVQVENLKVGDRALTVSGEFRSIIWIGRRTIDCRGEDQSNAAPVRVLAGAFGGGVPRRTLHLSPGHPVLLGAGREEVLVPIMCLINGTSIARAPVDIITYWHVELDRHDILFAEGLPVESYLDCGSREWFENGGNHALTNPDFIPPGLWARCRPVAIDGPIVEAERKRLDLQFYSDLTAQCAWPTPDRPWSRFGTTPQG